MRKRFSLILATALLCVGNLVAQISSLPVPIGETKWRTLMAPVTLEIPDGITAYTVPSVSDGYVNLVEIAGEFIPANVPVLLQADAAGDYEFLIASGEFEVGDNLLEGTIAKEYVSMSPDYNYYVFDEGECVWLPAVSIEEMEDCFLAEAYTAYLQVPTMMAESYSSLSIATVTASGSCGENLTWMLTAEGELIVEGTGEITSIPWRDFKGTITKVTLSAGVTGTVSYAFEGCSSLTTVNIPENSQLINIETGMFQNCSSLASITIPKSVTEIANYAFRNCGGLTSITIKSTTPPTIGYYSFVGVDMFVYVPTGSVAAYKEAEHWSKFANIQAIVSLVSSGTCGDNLTWELTDDGKLTIEGTGAMTDYEPHSAPWFSYKDDIKTVTIKPGVTTIGKYAIGDCGNLTTVTIPEGVTSIGLQAFQYCYKLASVTLSDGLKTIDWGAFAECHELPSIDIPEGVTTIGNYAFTHCFKLSTVTIPESVTSIGIYAFRNTAIISVMIPANISSLSQGTFENCPNLSSITCKAETPPSVGHSETFYNVNRSIPVYVPASSVEAYKAADYWSLFANIQPMIIASGTCGENLTWKYIDGGKLLIEGTGEMFDYSNNSAAPWQNYKGSIKSIDIKDGVTSVGSWAFSQCPILTDVSIAESVTSIGGDAFRECSILEEITLPKGLTELGTGVFLYCSALKSVTVPEGVTKIGSDTFEFCPQLSSITFPSGLTEIGPWALKGAYSLTSITCKAATPPSLGNEVFSGVSYDITVYVPTSSVEAYKTADGWNQFANIQPIILGSGTCGDDLAWKLTDDGKLTIEGTGAMYGYGWSDSPWFSHREFITEVVIPEGVTNIGEGIFWDCTGLAEITIPAGVTSIDNYAFSGCRNLVAVSVPESVKSIGVYAFQNCNSLTAITIPEGVMSIGNNTFENCNSLIAITIPEGVMNIGSNAFFCCSGLTSIACNTTTPPAIEDQWSLYGVDKSIPVYVPVSAVAAYKEANYWKEFTNILPMGTFGDNLTWMLTAEGELIIEGTGAMTDYSYGNWAPWYDYRESILSINIGEGVTTIANQTFRDCTSLTTVTIPACVTTIGEAAFYNCPSLATANMAEDSQLESIGYNAFRGCKSLTDFAIPATVTNIGEHAFHGCEELASITIPVGMTTIETRAFQDCRKFNTITIPAGVTTIKDCAFSGCENLETINFPENSQLIAIGTEAFYNCQKLGSVIIPASVTTMGEGVFKSCIGLISATIPAGVTTIEYETFESCSSLTNVVFPENSQLTTIGTEAFWSSGLTSIAIPANVTTIGRHAFRYCDNLTSFIIPDNSQLTTIGFASFLGCSALTSITLPAGLTSLDMGAFKECTSLTSMTCNATTPPAVNSSETFYNINRSIPVYVPASAVAAYKEADYWKEFTNIQAPIIDSGTCGENLTWKINGAYELTIEGMGAMYNYSNNSAAPWQNYKGSIKSIDIKDGVTSVGSWAFSQCPILTDVSIAESVTSIGGDAFRECSILEEITLPKGLTELGTGVFLYCSALKSVTVPEGVTKIGSDTFEFCPQLSSITFPSGLTEIGPWALKGAYSLTSITCKAATPPSLGNEVFSGVSYDITVYVPTSSVEAYKTAEGWSQFANIQPIILGSGTCGDDLAWKLTDEGKLIIKGEGAITTAPWEAYGEQVKEVVLEEGVTGIADGAFADLENLASITSYAKVPPVCGEDAFAGIENITPVYVPADVVEEYEAAEGWEAFTYLSSMNSRVLLDTYATYAHAEDEEFDKITYVRNFTSNNWETLYLPFEIDYWDICEDFDVAYIYDTHQYDTDDDGVKDETVIEIFKIKDGILEANYPYLIRAKEAGEKEIVVTDATLYATEEVTLDYSSIFDTYTFTTTYSSIPAGGFEQGKGYYTLVDGMWLPASKYTMLGAFRFYLKVDSRNGSPVAEARSIRMRIVGEGGDDSTTGIDSSEIMNDGSAVVYDLQGRRVAQPAKGINIMKMKDGSVGKVMVK